jgi:glycosyltransferase involved in cell wall biosynthesis
LTVLQDKTRSISPGSILCFVTAYNEIDRLPYFLDHHRSLGVDHFVVVDNDSTDGTTDFLAKQPDVSLWHSTHSYRKSKFGIAWVGWLLRKYGTGHWCLTLDCDELFTYPNCDTNDLRALTAELDRRNTPSLRSVMLDLYPKGPIDLHRYIPGSNPVNHMPFFDADNFTRYQHPELLTLVEKGGVRARHFFSDRVNSHAPHMQKTPLVKWRRSYCYLDSTHTLLPRHLNQNYASGSISGALLHTKFLPIVMEKSADQKHRQEHFTEPAKYGAYYEEILKAPDLWNEQSVKYENWRQLVALGLMSDGGWE